MSSACLGAVLGVSLETGLQPETENGYWCGLSPAWISLSSGPPLDPIKPVLRAASSPLRCSPRIFFFPFTSENYLIRWGSNGMPKEIEKLNNLQAVFTVSPTYV